MPTNYTVKLHKFMAQAGIASRRKSEELIAAGKVKVNDLVATVGQRINPNQDQVEFNKQILNPKTTKRYFLVNKPVGVVSTTNDELGRPTVLSLLPKEIVQEQNLRLFPVGRLDIDSQGLLLLTNDGELTQRLTHPKFAVEKTYLVRLDRRPTDAALVRLQKGVKLTDGWAHVTDFHRHTHEEKEQIWFEISVSEGRNRLIRRIWERLGYEVIELIRISFGQLKLDQLNNQSFIEIPAPNLSNILV